MPKTTKKKLSGPVKAGNYYGKARQFVWSGSWLRKSFSLLLAAIIVFTLVCYGVGKWYVHKHANEPLVLGASFVPNYAESFGLDPNDTLEAMLSDLKLKQVRLVSYWDNIEPTQGQYDFSELDSEFALANKYSAKVSLSVGLRQPRWPECHEPDWITIDPNNKQAWQPQLYQYMTAVINRYKDNPALGSYELENEFFMTVFGECTDFDRQRLISEFNMLKKLDPNHKVIISRSDNWIGIPVGQPKPDEYAVSVYKRVWDAVFTHRYFEYPLPTWFYSSLAGWGEIFNGGRNMSIHELQAEPWTPQGMEITQTSLDEQFKSMNSMRMKARIEYGEATGMRSIDLWGAEWWYWLKVSKNDPSVWNVVKQEVAKAEAANKNLK